MATIATLAVQLVARTAPFRKGLKKAQGLTTKFASGIAGVATKAAKFGAVLGAIAVGALAFFIKQSFTALDAVGKLADQIGVGVDALQGLQFAAGLTGVSSEKLNKGLQKLSKNIGEAQQGTGLAKVAFKALGISIDGIAKLKPDEQFKLIADKMSGLKTQTEKVAVAFQLFGRVGADLVNTFQLGSEGIQALIEENRRLQGSLSRLDVKQIEEANDSIGRLKTAFTGFINTLAVRLAPFVRNAALTLAELFITFRERALPAIGAFVKRAIEFFRKLAVAIIPTVILWASTILAQVKLVAGFFAAGMKTIFSALSNVLKLITGSAPTFQGFKKTIQDVLIVAKFAFKNFEGIVDVVLDSAFSKFATFKSLLFTTANFIKDNLGAILAEPFREQINEIKFFVKNAIAILGNIPGLLAGTKTFEGLFIPLEKVEKKLLALPQVLINRSLTPDEIFARGVLESSRAQLISNFKDFRKNELAALAQTESGLDKFLGKLFDFELTPLDVVDIKLDPTSEEVLKKFPQPDRLEALRRGTVAAFQAERRGGPGRKTDTEKNTKTAADEQKKSNEFLKKIAKNSAPLTVVTIPA